eukprot:1157746-Pelagomonas_calceolata.AAC.8
MHALKFNACTHTPIQCMHSNPMYTHTALLTGEQLWDMALGESPAHVMLEAQSRLFCCCPQELIPYAATPCCVTDSSVLGAPEQQSLCCCAPSIGALCNMLCKLRNASTDVCSVAFGTG